MVSRAGQVAQLQKEVTPGTPLTNAMIRPLGMKLRPRITGSGGNTFRAAGFVVPTAHEVGDLWSTWAVEGVQDFNALGLILASVFGPPVTTGTAPVFTHVFTPKASGADTIRSYTAQYGSTGNAWQAAMMVFQALGLTIERGNLSMSSSAISRLADENATFITAGVTDMPAVLIPSTGYDVFADDTWAALGTSKLLACYRAELNATDKYDPDAPINSALNGFESVVEKEERELTSNWTLGFNAVSKSLISTFKSGAKKFIRLAVDGPIITGVTRYSLKYDTCTQLTDVGDLGTAPGSATEVLPFTGTMMYDPVSAKFAQVTLVNSIASY